MKCAYETTFNSLPIFSDVFGGGSADWAHAVARIRYSYLIELRDTGQHGFLLPDDQILPTCQEAWAAVRELGGHILLNVGFTRPAHFVAEHAAAVRSAPIDDDDWSRSSSAAAAATVDVNYRTSAGMACLVVVLSTAVNIIYSTLT